MGAFFCSATIQLCGAKLLPMLDRSKTMKTKLIVALTGLLLTTVLLASRAEARDNDERRGSYSEERGGSSHTFHRDNNNQRDHYGQRDDARGQGFYDRSERRDDDRRNDRHHRRDRDDERVYYRDEHRHYRDYDAYPRRIIVDHPRYEHPRRVIYYVDDYGYRRGYYVSDSYYEHYYDSAYYRHGRHSHIGCHYHGFFDAVAAGIIISAIVGDW
jgi:hypothetical protein